MTDSLLSQPLDNVTRLWLNTGLRVTDGALGEPTALAALTILLAVGVGYYIIKFAGKRRR